MAPITNTHLNIKRLPHELIKPAKPTPHEYKLLSDIDDLECLHLHLPMIQFYRNDPALVSWDPVKIIREAVKETLVYYYPYAGRLRKVVPGHKLLVECTSEGVLFVEADANVTLDEFGELHPPFPLEDLLYNVPGSDGIIDSPLLLIQVTRLKCGGFVFALRFNHIMSDGAGIYQFMTCISEMARSARSPSVLPIWQREIFLAKTPRQLEYYNQVPDTQDTFVHKMDNRSFYLGRAEISVLRRLIPPHLSKCSTVDVLTALLWRCRTIALHPDPEEEMHALIAINMRNKLTDPPIPIGYYGNAAASFIAISKARKLWENPLDYTLELVMKAKAEMTEEHLRLWLDTMFTVEPPQLSARRTFIVSDLTKMRCEDVDFGWGKAAYGGPAKSDVGVTNSTCFYTSYTNKYGVHGVMVSFSLPAPVMERFASEIDKTIKYNKLSIISAL